jgi:hypothetical protein
LLIKFIQEGKKIEAFSPDETSRGQQIHQLLSEAIESKDFSLANAELKCDIGMVFDPLLKQYERIECEKYGTFRIQGNIVEFHIDWSGEKGKEVLIIDYKSGYWTDILPEYEHQFVYYAYAFLDIDPSLIIKTANYFSASNELKYSKTYMFDDMPQLAKIIMSDIKRWHKIEETHIEELQGVVSKMCNYCGYPRSCPSYPDEVLDTPEKIIAELIKAEKRVKDLRKLGKNAVLRAGKPILIDTMWAGFESVEKRIIDNPIGLYNYLQEHGTDIHTIFKPSLTPFKKFGKENEELFAFSSIKTTQKFVLRDLTSPKKGDDEDE